MIAKGELGYIPAKHIVNALPEEGERPSSTHKKITVDGWDREDEEEVRSHPTSRRQLERLHLTFRTTLLMCTAALPQFGNLRVTKEELDDWYAWFYGEDIAGRKPPPSDTTLLFAERNAWRKIHEMVHQGTTLSEALKNIRGDFLFWQREVYEHLNRAPEKGKSKSKAPKVWQTQGKGKSQHPLDPMAGPLGFQESQRGGVLQRSSPSQQVFGIMRPIPQLPGGCVMPPHRSMCHMPTPSQVTGGHSGCHRPRGFLVFVGITGHQCESAHSGGEPTPPEPQRKADRAGEARTAAGRGFLQGATPSTEEEERTQPGHSRRAQAPLSPAPTEATPRETQSPGTDDWRVRQRTHGIPRGGQATFPSWMQDTPERLRLR